MKLNVKGWVSVALIAVLAFGAASCSSDLTRSASPVALIVTNTQDVHVWDIAPTAANCARNFGTIQLRSILKNADPNVDQRFNDVRIRSYRVSYVRTDGGTQVPQPFVRSMDLLLTTGGASESATFFISSPGMLNQAPFAALQPQNGGRDVETGKTFITMDIVVDIFGETLAGTAVAGSTRMPMEFCFDCGGCS